MKVAIIGDGLSAVACAAFLARRRVDLIWIQGTGSRMVYPISSISRGDAFTFLNRLASEFELDVGEETQGLFIREARNKAFRNPPWAETFDPDLRQSTIDESVTSGESRLIPLFESRFEDLEIREIEDALRARVLEMPWVKRLEGIPLLKVTGDQSYELVLGNSADPVKVDALVYCDRLLGIKAIEGMPGLISGTHLHEIGRKTKPCSVLQYLLKHRSPIASDMKESFCVPLQRESDEKEQKNIWGSFSKNGMESVWTLFLDADETEDNHVIVKRLRRMRQALNKAFSAEFISSSENHQAPTGEPRSVDFTALIQQEQVRFEENFITTRGEVLSISQSRLAVLTDAFGAGAALQAVEQWTHFLAGILETKHESLDLFGPSSDIEPPL